MKDKNSVRKKKRTALVLTHDGGSFWTTQTEFWQWARTGVVRKVGDAPLTGVFRCRDEEKKVVLGHVILNLGAPNHLQEVLAARRAARAS